MVNILSHQRNVNQHQSEWLKSKTQASAGTAEDVEKEEHSSITCGTASWYNHSGNQFGVSSKTGHSTI
jgi:rare lipoprotein A (peptidoglycan hydrolase)